MIYKESNSTMELIKVLYREDQFESRYFDQQISHRYLFRLADNNTIESGVYQHYFDKEPTTIVFELSTMVGCPIGCKFCESTSFPYVRQLTVDEMMSQLTLLARRHSTLEFPKLVCSFQGIGEPSLIPKKIIELSKRVQEFNKRFVLSISTTASRLDAIELWRNSKLHIDNLQFSLHGTTDKQIKQLVPASPSIDKMIDEIRLCSQTPSIQKVKCNYVLVQDFNDSDDDIQRLGSFFRNSQIIVRLSSLNPTLSSQNFGLTPSSLSHAREICTKLKTLGIDSFVFGAFTPINVSCGQLTFTEISNL